MSSFKVGITYGTFLTVQRRIHILKKLNSDHNKKAQL